MSVDCTQIQAYPSALHYLRHSGLDSLVPLYTAPSKDYITVLLWVCVCVCGCACGGGEVSERRLLRAEQWRWWRWWWWGGQQLRRDHQEHPGAGAQGDAGAAAGPD